MMDACFGASFRHIDANLVKTVYTGRDPRTGLLFSVEGLRYLDFPVVEWVVWLRNDNAADTPVIGALRVCDAAFPSGSSSLWSSWGDTCVTRTVNSYLLDLGNDEAQRWLTDFLCDFIQMHGVKIYRQDFNFPPLTCWNANEAEDRQGFLENRHVQGCLAFWDALLERNHGLSIDSCAAGGRRNDLETMRRSVSFLKSDYGYDIPGEKRAFHQTLYQWIPYFASHTIAKRLEEETTDYKWKRPKNQFDSYAFHHTLKKGCDYYGYLYTSGPACV